MKILLVALNAKYIHSNIAVYSLRAFADKYADNIKIIELTINHLEDDILKKIYMEKADIIAFSCYIWNIDMITRITSEVKKVQKDAKIWYGGPEASYKVRLCLQENESLDGIMYGEGEETFRELVSYYLEGEKKLNHIKGIAFKDSALTKQDKGDGITVTDFRPLLDLDTIPFPYKDIEIFQNKIIYYESSRGCPFSCSYCLSSIDKKVRLRCTELVKKELKLMLDKQVPQVKFVDRTFNCNKKHAMEIWRFIKEYDNGITNFHFEISADLLTEEEIEFLGSLRPGQVQFEIGVQSTNPDTVAAIHRKMDFHKLSQNVKKIKEGRNIHQHLDLIAGLPLEDYSSFEQSFKDVYQLKPDQLQLGFLKILKGSLMEEESSRYGIIYRDFAPYEVLSTNQLSYEEVLRIKGICEMVEVYYNSAQFTYSITFLEHFYSSPMKLYQALSDYYEEKGYAMISHSRVSRYEILHNFYLDILQDKAMAEEREDYVQIFKELLVFDMLLREGMKSRPDFYVKKTPQSNLRELYKKYPQDRRIIHMEPFSYDLEAASLWGKAVKKDCIIVFDYSQRDSLSYAAKYTKIE